MRNTIPPFFLLPVLRGPLSPAAVSHSLASCSCSFCWPGLPQSSSSDFPVTQHPAVYSSVLWSPETVHNPPAAYGSAVPSPLSPAIENPHNNIE